MSGDLKETFEDWRAYKRAIKYAFGSPCLRCREKLPKASPTILMPGQKCFDGYVDPRPHPTQEQRKFACEAAKAPYFEKVK